MSTPDRTFVPRDLLRPLTVCLFFAGLAFLFWKLFRDFGPHWDEKTCQSYGIDTWNFVFHRDLRLLSNPDLDHGPFVETLLVFAQKMFSAQSWREIVLARHGANAALFFAAVGAFYRIGLIYFGRWQSALMGCLLLVLHPRIFSEAFYNSKDVGFLSVFVIAIYTLERYRSSPTWFWTLCHAIMTGACVATRLPGLVIPVITAVTQCAAAAADPAQRTSRSLRLVLYLAMSAAFALLFWPALWPDPIGSFVTFFQNMESYTQGPWGVIFEGHYVPRHLVPVRYLFQWIMITTPFAFLTLLLAGVTFMAARTGSLPVNRWMPTPAVTVGLWVLIPLAHYFLRRPNIYDGWRHYYFLYPAFVLCMVEGWGVLRTALGGRRLLVTAAALLVLAEPVRFIWKTHPSEQVYFNRLAGPKELMHQRYDMDYWGLSYRQGFEYLLDTVSRPVINVFVSDEPGSLNYRFLEKADAERIRLVREAKDADYILTVFRRLGPDSPDMTQPPPGFRRDVMIQADGVSILAVYQRKPSRKAVSDASSA